MRRRHQSFGRDPFQLHREIDRLFAELLGSPPRGSSSSSSTKQETSEDPSVEFLEKDDAYLIGLDVPDYHRDELEVVIEGQRLTIRGEQDAAAPGKTFHHRFDLGRDVPPEEIDAAFRNGILVVRVAKPPQEHVRHIEVQ